MIRSSLARWEATCDGPACFAMPLLSYFDHDCLAGALFGVGFRTTISGGFFFSLSKPFSAPLYGSCGGCAPSLNSCWYEGGASFWASLGEASFPAALP